MTEVCDAGGLQVKADTAELAVETRQIEWAVETNWFIMRHRDLGTVNASSRDRVRIVAAWVCLFAAVGLYAPLAGGAWSAHSMACCTGDHCPIAQHHHQKKQASPPAEMDCGHDLGVGEGMNCSMSCCQSSENPLVTAVAFVLPDLSFASASAPV